MKVTLAVPFDGHQPDETIEVDDATGRRLLHDGFARRPVESPTPDLPDTGEEE